MEYFLNAMIIKNLHILLNIFLSTKTSFHNIFRNFAIDYQKYKMTSNALFEYLIISAIALYLFMGTSLIVVKTPRRDLYIPYRRSRRVVGAAFLVIALNMAFLWIGRVGEWPDDLIFTADLVSYYTIYILLTIASINLFKHNYPNKKNIRRQAAGFAVLTAIATGTILVPESHRQIPQLAGTVWLFGYIIWFILHFRKTIRETKRKMESYHNHELKHYIRWVVRNVVLWVVFGLASTFILFSPNWSYAIFLTYGVGINCYIYGSLQNYLIYYETVELAIREVEKRHRNKQRQLPPKTSAEEARENKIGHGLQMWLQMKGFTRTGITIEQLALQIGTNRSYLSAYINRTYGNKFSNWLNQLRLKHAKSLLIADRDLSMEEVAMQSGFSSSSYFTKIFVKSTGKPPVKWKELHARTGMDSDERQ